MMTSFANISAPTLPFELINCKLKGGDQTKIKEYGAPKRMRIGDTNTNKRDVWHGKDRKSKL